MQKTTDGAFQHHQVPLPSTGGLPSIGQKANMFFVFSHVPEGGLGGRTEKNWPCYDHKFTSLHPDFVFDEAMMTNINLL